MHKQENKTIRGIWTFTRNLTLLVVVERFTPAVRMDEDCAANNVGGDRGRDVSDASLAMSVMLAQFSMQVMFKFVCVSDIWTIL